MKVVIAGGNGFIGATLADRLAARGDEVVALVRTLPDAGASRPESVRFVRWDGEQQGPWADELGDADALINVTGSSIGDGRPTPANIERLIASRVGPIAALAEALGDLGRRVPVWIQAAAVGIFGDGGDAVLTEASVPSGDGPAELVRTCTAWEAAFATAVDGADGPVERPVLLRFGVVLGGGDPTTAVLAQLVRARLGGRAGDGKQWVSWVSIDDVVGVVERALDDHSMTGTYHVTAPNPVTNDAMMAGFRAALDVGFGLPAPAFAVKLGAWVRGTPPSLVLASQRVVPQRLLDDGYRFAAPDFDAAAAAAVAARR